MKKFITVLSALILSVMFMFTDPSASWSASEGYKYSSLTGGGAGALDSLDGAALFDGDFALVMASGVLYSYVLDEDSGLAESSPLVIAPDANAGVKRWIMLQSSAAIGFGQTWQTPTRSANVVYQNTTGRAIQISMTMACSAYTTGSGGLYVGPTSSPAVLIGGGAQGQAEAYPRSFFASAIVPNNYYYTVATNSGMAVSEWHELR